MKKIEFYEVNFGENQLHPLMTAKCFSSQSSANDYAREIGRGLIRKLSSYGSSLIKKDYVSHLDMNHGDSTETFVFLDSNNHLDIYEIKVLRHYYILEDCL